MIKTIAPFAYGYFNCKSENVSMKIAQGMYHTCKYLPLTIDPEIGLASIDRSPANFIEKTGVAYVYGDGIVVNETRFAEMANEHPEYSDTLNEYCEYFKPLNTYSIVKGLFSDHEQKAYLNSIFWGGTWGGHSNPDFGMAVALGTEGLRKKVEKYRAVHPEADEWYRASLVVLDGIEILGERFRQLALELSVTDPDYKEVYHKIANALQTVPKKPAYDFMTACQSFYIFFSLDGRDSPGTFDRYMIDYYRNTPKDEARRILEGLWIGFHKTRCWNLCISGSDSNFNDVTNELSYEILDIAAKFKFQTPNLTMRLHRGTPDYILDKAIETLATGIGVPAMYNDEAVCPALEALGIPPDDSHKYAMNGCNQIDIQGKSHSGLEDGEICLLKCFEYALFNGMDYNINEKMGLETGNAANFKTFDEFFGAFKKQAVSAIEQVVELANRSQKIFSEYAPNPLRSMLMEGCLEKGKDYKCGGPTYNHGQILTEGLADTIDSLSAIKHFVYDTDKYTMAQVVEACKNDWANAEDMRLEFLNYEGKFGNDHDETDNIASEVISHFFGKMADYRTFRDPVNGIYGGGLSTFQRTGRYGKAAWAAPNGRHAHDVNIADSIGATPGKDKKGPTALINSALKYDHKLAKSGFVLQMKFDKHLFNTEKGKAAFKALVKTYFAGGGQQITTNILSRDELLDARKHPEKYSNLIVRVGGYSDYFVNLSPELQENVINRTMYEL